MTGAFITLFVDDSRESEQARNILKRSGLSFETLPSSGANIPAAQVGPAVFYGLSEITKLVSELSTSEAKKKPITKEKTGLHPRSNQVRRYLNMTFPGCSIVEFEFVERDSYGFRIENDVKHRLLVTSEFLDDVPETHIVDVLKSWRLAEQLRRVGYEWVVVTSVGLRVGLP